MLIALRAQQRQDISDTNTHTVVAQRMHAL